MLCSYPVQFIMACHTIIAYAGKVQLVAERYGAGIFRGENNAFVILGKKKNGGEGKQDRQQDEPFHLQLLGP